VVVGDLRQEIYTFTGTPGCSLMSDPPARLGLGDRPWTCCPLNQTYRMSPAIVAALNANYRGPADPPLVAVRAAGDDDPAPRHVTVGPEQLLEVVLEVLRHHAVEQMAVLAPSVRSDVHGALTLAEALVERGVRVHSTHAQDAALSPDVLCGKLFISTYHQAKGREWDAVVVLGADARLTQETDCMYPPLHVALTRARSRLTVVTAPSQALYPTTTPTLHGFSSRPALPREPLRRARPAKGTGWLKKYSLRWAVDFASDAVLRYAAECLAVERLEVAVVPAAAAAPPATVKAGNALESVLQYYPQAVLARAAALTGTPDPAYAAPLREPGARRARMAGPLLTEAQRALRHGFITARDWLMVTSVAAAIRSGIRHPLKQLPASFDWVDEGFIEAEAAGLVAALAAEGTPVFGQWFKRDSPPHRVSLCCIVPAVTSVGLDGAQTPWRYSSAEAPTELDLLVSAVTMWLVRSTAARVYCRGSVYTVTVSSAAACDALVGLCFDHKRR
jgi:hypothetical protein